MAQNENGSKSSVKLEPLPSTFRGLGDLELPLEGSRVVYILVLKVDVQSRLVMMSSNPDLMSTSTSKLCGWSRHQNKSALNLKSRKLFLGRL